MQPPENTAGSAATVKSSSSECFRNVSPIRSSCPFQSLCANRHAASTQAAMITIHRYEKVLSFTHFSVIGTASISKAAKYRRYPKTSYFRLHFQYPCQQTSCTEKYQQLQDQSGNCQYQLLHFTPSLRLLWQGFPLQPSPE